MSLPFGALGRPLPLLVLDSHIRAVLHQSLDTDAETENITSSDETGPGWDFISKMYYKPSTG